MTGNIYLPTTCRRGTPGCNAEALVVPLGGVAKHANGTLLPRHIGVRGYVCGGALVLWVMHSFEVADATTGLTLQYAVPRTCIQPSPLYQPALLYPPRSLVQHGSITYQNMTSDDLATPPPRGWTAVPQPPPVPVSQCTAAVALAMSDGKVAIAAAAQPGERPAVAAPAECLMPPTDSDEIYLLHIDRSLAAGDCVLALWQLQVPLMPHLAVLVPSLAHRCSVSVRCPRAPSPLLDVDALVQPVERIRHGAETLWWYPELKCYRNVQGRRVHLAAVAQQLGAAAYHGVRVVMPDSGIWTQEGGAMIRTEVHLGLPPATLQRISLQLPVLLVLQQLPVPLRPSTGRYLLVTRGHVLATEHAPTEHEKRGTANWYSYVDHAERLAWNDDTAGVLWVVHRPHDPAPRVMWTSEDSWETEEEWDSEEYAYTECPPEHQLVAALAAMQVHREEMMCRMWEEGHREPTAMLLLLCSLDSEVPWQALSAELRLQWPRMRPCTENLPLLQQVLQLLARMSARAVVACGAVQRTRLQAPHALPGQPLGGWSGGRLAVTAVQGATSLAAQRCSPWTRHLGADYNCLQKLLVQATAPEAAAEAELYRHLHSSFSASGE